MVQGVPDLGCIIRARSEGIGGGAGQLHSVTFCYKKLVVVFSGGGIMMVRVR